MPAVTLAAGFFLSALAVYADAAQEVIDQVVVVAHKDSRPIHDIAATVTVLNRADLDDQLATSINDVLRYLPGIDYEGAGTRFGTEGINIRGIGGNRVAIVVDGVPLSDHFDVGSFSNATRDFVDAGLIQSVEVLHGPASALYGSSAIGGVVAVRTPDPFHLAGARGVGGRFAGTVQNADDSEHMQAMLGIGGESLGFMAGASWHEGEQINSAAAADAADTRQMRRRTGLAKLVGDNRFGHTWRAEYIRQQSTTESALTSLLGQGRYSTTTALEGDDQYEVDLVIAAYEFGTADSWIDNGSLRGFYEFANIEQATLDERRAASTPVSIERLFMFEQEIKGAELNLWKEFSGASISQRLGFGIEYRDRRTAEYRDGLSTNLVSGAQTSNLLGEQFPLRDFPLSTTQETGAYLEDTITAGDWTIIAALRADRFELAPRQDPMYFEDYPFAELVDIDDAELSPKLGLIYHATAGVDLYLQYAHGFRAPPYADANIGLEIPLFNYRAIPNPDLKSESSDGLDLGLRWTGRAASARVAMFYTRYDDFIESKVRLGTDPVSGRVLFQSQNLRATRIYGVEAGFDIRLDGAWQAFSVDGSAYFARGENKDTGAALNSVGPPQAVFALNWHAADERRYLRLATTLSDDWSERDESGGELFKPDGHVIVDLFATQKIGARTTLRAGLHNLTDRTYWNWSDVQGLAPDDPLLPYLAQSGRSASVSLNLDF
ncbi:MAG: TonB-dependent receptor [Gammaproteobacteria bacterium]|nr:TonB-dependent receptor [Gammaproteobacteria bacterium]MDH5302676.1 TonB-dependent receptor [Gammaproteobacteria bacterium]MDH5320887.1 TonB-dependent receptor [Gammaproteobacteria bacterium]